MSEYRDALVTARERVARLEALAHERGLLRPSRRPLYSALVLLAAALGSLVFYLALRPLFEKPAEEVWVERPSPPPPFPPLPARDLEWFEPTDSWNPNRGPLLAHAEGKRLLVGMLWLRGERTNGLYLGAFDFERLTLEWRVGPFESEWTGDEQERFHLVVDEPKVILNDANGVVRVFALANGRLEGKIETKRGAMGICRALRPAPMRLMIGFGVHMDPATAAAVFPWEVDHVQPFFIDADKLTVAKAPITPPSGTWCGVADYCDLSRKDGCHDESSEWHYGPYGVRFDPGKEQYRIIGSAKGEQLWQFVLPPKFSGTLDESAMSATHFFHAYSEGAEHKIVALDLSSGKPRFFETGVSSGARLRVLKWSEGRLFALYDDEMLVFDEGGKRLGKLSGAAP